MFGTYSKALFYVVFLLIFPLLPVYIFRKKPKELVYIGIALCCFLIAARKFLFAELTTYYDSKVFEYFSLITKQWLDSNIAIGWNPYMNAGEPLYLFSNYFLWAPWVFFCWVNRFIAIDPHALFNIFYIFLYINFCIGSLLLFLLVFDDFRVAFFCFCALLMSRLFFISLGQFVGFFSIYYFPYILVSFLSFLKYKNITGLIFAVIFLGVALNHYLPHYIFISSSVCIFMFYLFKCSWVKETLAVVRKNLGLAFAGIFIALLAGSTVLFVFLEAKRYASPDRGAVSILSGIQQENTGTQASVNASLKGYKVLLERNNDTQIHHAFYFGILPLLLFLLACIWCRERYFWALLVSLALILLFGLGFVFWGYRVLSCYLPGFNMMRHSFPFALFVSFILIWLSGYGLKLILKKTNRFIYAFVFLLLAIDLLPFYGKFSQRVFEISGAFENSGLKNYRSPAGLLVKMGERFIPFNTKPIIPAAFNYPLERSFIPEKSFPIAPDLSGLVFKKAALLHLNYFVFFRDKHLNDMLSYQAMLTERSLKELGVGTSLISFSRDVSVLARGSTKESYIRSVCDDSLQDSGGPSTKIIFLEDDIDFKPVTGSDYTTSAKIGYKTLNDPNVLEFDLAAENEGYLLRLENFHPSWQAFIDGRRVKIYRANYAFQAVKAPAGIHHFRFVFHTIYPFLFYTHVIIVFLAYIFFNIYLYRLRNSTVKISS